MRIVFGSFLAIAAIGCGGKIDEGESTSSSSPACKAAQASQKIATVPGAAWTLASAGSVTYAVTSMPGDSGGVSSSRGTLYRIEDDGTATALTDDFVDPQSLVSAGSTLGFLDIRVDPDGSQLDGEVETVGADGSIGSLDSADPGSSFGPLVSDGQSFDWFQWTLANGKRESLPVIVSGTNASALAITKIEGTITGVGSFASDGSNDYAIFDADGSNQAVLGRLPTRGASELVLADATQDPLQVIGVDAENVYYLSSTEPRLDKLMSVPKTGGSPTELASTPFFQSLALRDGHAYWLEPEAAQTKIMTVPLDGTAAESEVAAIGASAIALGATPCGLVYAVVDDSLASTDVEQLSL